MSDPIDIVERLRMDFETGRRTGLSSPRFSTEEVGALFAEIDRLRAEAKKLRTVMVAAAEEIAAHWDAHCDAEGYGPVNLQRRLEEGIPSEYGYTAGAFAELKAEIDRLRAALAQPAAPDGWAVRDRSDLEPGAIDLTSPGTGRVVLLPAHRDAHSRMLYELAAAMLAASPQAPQPGAQGA